ncbi:MAG: hypothetical protein LBJ88_05570 [Campylobacteraceae bacterium]|nr:hypothetical protein [Campylobacteraceae bacterium]
MAKFFSSSENIKKTFEKYFNESDFCVIGIGDECQKAYEYALSSQERIDMLQLFSPQNIEEIEALKNRGVDIEIYVFANDESYDKSIQELKKYAFVYTIKNGTQE